MPSKVKEHNSSRIRAKHEKEKAQKVETIVFGLLDASDVRHTEFDSVGPVHRRMMKEVGAIGWLAYNICHLNGRGKEFDRTILEAKFLLLHVENKSSIKKEDIKNLKHQITHSKRANSKLMIFATSEVPIDGQGVIRIKDINEIKKHL